MKTKRFILTFEEEKQKDHEKKFKAVWDLCGVLIKNDIALGVEEEFEKDDISIDDVEKWAGNNATTKDFLEIISDVANGVYASTILYEDIVSSKEEDAKEEISLPNLKQLLINVGHEGFRDVVNSEEEDSYLVEYLENSPYYKAVVDGGEK
ncbi:MAG: hypothetical protein DRQ88_06045 [Epsilonproteobacteria bacterium]|nr:MAG: hypothetical protein DRQ88_06045 [Campylobacterota bacterium]